MDTVLTDLAVSISEFKKNPAEVLRKAGVRPVAVLSHNRPAFYMVEPKLFASLLEQLADLELADLVEKRLAMRADAIEVDIDSV